MSAITIKNSKPTTIKVITAPKNTISINTKGGLAGGGGDSELRRLSDVIATDLTDNDTIVYDAERDRFVVEELPIINGGEF